MDDITRKAIIDRQAELLIETVLGATPQIIRDSFARLDKENQA